MFQCSITLAEIKLPVSLRFRETGRYFNEYGLTEAEENSAEGISVSKAQHSQWLQTEQEITPFTEYSLLSIPASEQLMVYGGCIFHAAAFRWRDRAWLIAAQSGVGKSSRLKTLMEKWPEEVSVINGDKPALLCREDGSVLVCPSPWNGKEGWHGAEAAPLGGIFILQRGEEDLIRPADNVEKAVLVFLSVIHSWKDEETLRLAGKMADRVGRSVPVWHLTGYDIAQSTQLICDELRKEAERLGL